MKTNIVLILFLITIFLSCNSAEKKDCCKIKPKTASAEKTALPDQSIFNLTSKWKTQNNVVINLDTLKGKICVAAMVFTYCESACPRIVADIQRIEKAFSSEELKQIQFLLISMDPERDTPERFQTFAKEHQLNENWTLISGSEDATMEIANVLNVRVKKLGTGGFDHSNIIHIIDKQGLIVFQQNGLAQQPDDAIKQIKALF